MRKLKLILSIAVQGILTFAATGLAEPGGYRVSSYTTVGPEAKLIVIEGGHRDGVASGDVFRIFRPASAGFRTTGVSIETGAAKAMVVYEHKTIAEITQQSTPLSQQYYPRFPEIMAGDLAVQQRLEIRRSLALSPEINLQYGKLFEDPKANPQNFELSQDGRDELSREAAKLASARVGMLMVIGHTDAGGTSETNQIESYQRAVVVRQYLIDQLGFDSGRIVAIGKGEDELPEENLTPGYAARARRIVLKVVPLP